MGRPALGSPPGRKRKGDQESSGERGQAQKKAASRRMSTKGPRDGAADATDDGAGDAAASPASMDALRAAIREGEAAGVSSEHIASLKNFMESEETKAEVAEAARLADLNMLKTTIQEGEAAGVQERLLATARQAVESVEAAGSGALGSALGSALGGRPGGARLSAPMTPQATASAAPADGDKRPDPPAASALVGCLAASAARGGCSPSGIRGLERIPSPSMAANDAAQGGANLELAREFNEAFGIPALDLSDRGSVVQRFELVLSKAQELQQELYDGGPQGDVGAAMAGMAYTFYSVAASLGVDLDRGIAGVHFRNMRMLCASKDEAEECIRWHRSQCPTGCPPPALNMRSVRGGRWAVYNTRTDEVLPRPPPGSRSPALRAAAPRALTGA